MHEEDDIEGPAREPEPKAPADPSLARIERETIQEAIAARTEALRMEQEAAERARRSAEREERIRAARTARIDAVRRDKARRTRSLADADERARAHVASAARSIRAAMRSLVEIPLPRHSVEAREQRRMVSALETALGQLRGAGRTRIPGDDLDMDMDLDVG